MSSQTEQKQDAPARDALAQAIAEEMSLQPDVPDIWGAERVLLRLRVLGFTVVPHSNPLATPERMR